ncbi:MAG TPA: S8 family serine peptidase, partial [Kofleriaceae bacterium]|nr:S8 family serine peptidase [Kofleriaceae bacterium]
MRNVRLFLGALLVTSACGTAEDPDLGVATHKPDPVWRDGFEHRLVVKFADAQLGRVTVDGKVDFADPAAESDVDAVLADRGVRLRPLLDLPDAKLDAMEQAGGGSTDLRGFYRGEPSSDRAALLALARELNALASVQFAYLEPLVVPPPGDLTPASTDFVEYQTYRGAIEADYANALGGTGAGIRLHDVEYGWDAQHEDLVDRPLNLEPGKTIPYWVYQNRFADHGTAVLGETSAVDNGYGVTGLVPAADVFTFPEYTGEDGPRRVAAVAAAIAAARPGDVVLLEMQAHGAYGQYGPAEYDPALWQIVKAGTDAGVVVVAAAGNGGENLDAPAYAEYRARGDSGAIIVGAADAYHRRLSFSTFGQRVDLHGWGASVMTLGYGDAGAFGYDYHQTYTAKFAGTSSASPIVASACVAIQSYAKQHLGRVLSPRELRDLLVRTGTPQDASVAGAIGPLPNLRAAIAELGATPVPMFTSSTSSSPVVLETPSPVASKPAGGSARISLITSAPSVAGCGSGVAASSSIA